MDRQMQRLKRRKDFLAAARGPSCAVRSVVVQMHAREDEEPARIGFTVTKKLGGAVVRNRIRRRLKEAARLALGDAVKPGRDYVLIGRQSTAGRPFRLLQDDLVEGIRRVERSKPAEAGTRNRSRSRSGKP